MSHSLPLPLSVGDEPLIPPAQAAERLSVCRATLYAWIKSGKIGKPVRLSAGRVAFKPQTLRDFIAAREAEGQQ